MDKEDEKWMEVALEQAKSAFNRDEVPVGAVITFENRIIAKAHNLVETKKQAMAHAEMLCLKQAAQMWGDWRLSEMTLYCTMEPCMACAGAMILSRIRRLVWGAADHRYGANGSIVDLFSFSYPSPPIQIEQGVLADQSSALLRAFFQEKRNKKGQKTS